MIANQKQAERRLDRVRRSTSRPRGRRARPWSSARRGARGGQAEQAGRFEQAATSFAGRLIGLERQVDDLRKLVLDTTQAAEQAKLAVRQNATALQRKLEQREQLLSTLDQAKMHEQMHAAMAQLDASVGDDVPTFAEVQQKIDARLARDRAWPSSRGRASTCRCSRCNGSRPSPRPRPDCRSWPTSSDSRRCAPCWWRHRSPTWGSAGGTDRPYLHARQVHAHDDRSGTSPGASSIHDDFAGPHPAARSAVPCCVAGAGTPASAACLGSRRGGRPRVWVPFVAVAIGVALVQRDILTRLRDNPSSLRLADVAASDQQVAVLNGVGIALLACSPRPCGWCGGHRRIGRRAPGVPCATGRAGLWGRGSFPSPTSWSRSASPTSCGPLPGSQRGRDEGPRSSWLILGWWGSCLLSLALAVIAEREPDTVSEGLTTNAILMVRTVVIVVAGVLAIRLAGRITMGFTAPVSPGVESSPERGTRSDAPRGGWCRCARACCRGRDRISFAPRHRCARSDEDGASVRTGRAEELVRLRPVGTRRSRRVRRDQLADGADVTVIEMEGDGPVDAAEARANLDVELDLMGGIDEGSVELPGGHAVRFSLTAVGGDGSLFDGIVYVFDGDEQDYMVVLSAPSERADTYSPVLDAIITSFRMSRIRERDDRRRRPRRARRRGSASPAPPRRPRRRPR